MVGSDAAPDTRNLEILNQNTNASGEFAAAIQAIEQEEGLRFVAVTAEGISAERIAAAIRDTHGLECAVRPIFGSVKFAADVNHMDQFFEISLPGTNRSGLRQSVYDVAYGLRDETVGVRFQRIEPDLLNGAYIGEPDLLRFDFHAEQHFCKVEGECPNDHYWHLRCMGVPEAWNLNPLDEGKKFGAGISVAHPDTGWTEHLELAGDGALDTERSWNFYEGNENARDPLWNDALVALLSDAVMKSGDLRSPGHGTGTGSVIVSRGRTDLNTPPAPAEDLLTGVAPAATLVPIRAISHVFMERSVPVAEAIGHAADHDCHVISMSLGGPGTSALEAAVNYAVAKNVIVCAAAGNCATLPGFAGFISPANYPNCIGVAGTNIDDRPWARSSRGRTVDISAPAENVWKAELRRNNPSLSDVACSQGTSFAVAGVAGIAALWLAHHGRQMLIDRYKDHATLHHVFYVLMQRTARRPEGWRDDLFGAGIIDAAALLSAEPPDPSDSSLQKWSGWTQLTSAREQIAGLISPNTEPALVVTLSSLLAPMALSESQEAEAAIERWAPEFIRILAVHPAAYLLFATLVEQSAEGTETEQTRIELIRELLPEASIRLREVLNASMSRATQSR